VSFSDINRLVGSLVFLLTLTVYFLTVAPTVAFWDCGEFITTSYILGVPHPPGAPLYTLLGRIFSMLAFLGDEIALRVNFLSVASGAVTVVLLYLCVVRLLSQWLDRDDLVERVAIITGGVVSALSVAFSTSFWANASEAEVYGLSMTITLLAFWFALRWDDGHKSSASDRMLILIAYLFGLGAGVHLQVLLTIPGILILVFTDLMEDNEAPHQTWVATGLIIFPLIAIFAPTFVTALVAVGLIVALMLLRPEWQAPLLWLAITGLGLVAALVADASSDSVMTLGLMLGAFSIAYAKWPQMRKTLSPFWVLALFTAGLGFSTYLALSVRSGLDPLIDMNNPESWENFKAFLGRQQYGTHSSWPRRGPFFDYQLEIHIKYFLQQFPFYDSFAGTFRRAVPNAVTTEQVQVFSIIPLLFGIGGMVYHWRNDWRRFSSVLSMFTLMGLGLVLYLNMPDPEPREREYIFVGAYTFFGVWMGIGAAWLVVSLSESATSRAIVLGAAAVALILPAGILHNNLFSHDRRGDKIPYDYAYNILQTCAPNAVLFTNGDNDTYPLWFLQHVEGVRTDVRLVNLSLIKTAWYIEQLRDLEPQIPVGLTDSEIRDRLLAYPWDDPRDLSPAGLEIKADTIPTAVYRTKDGQPVDVIEAHTIMIWELIRKIDWRGDRPIYFAVTVPSSNQAGLRPYLSMEGMAYRLVDNHGPGQFDILKASENLMTKYRYRGVNDEAVYKDPVARRLLGNYLVLFEGLVQAFIQIGQYGNALTTLAFAEKYIPPHALDEASMWVSLSYRYRDIALGYQQGGKVDSAVVALERLIDLRPDLANADEVRAIIDTWRAESPAVP
tara:strand:- start:8686 stop:11199 length:2514 start_codon:yes stop_codon:yes gene_type:complete